LTLINHFSVIGPEATKFGEITQNNGYYAFMVRMRLNISD